jgi:hypothetical protein
MRRDRPRAGEVSLMKREKTGDIFLVREGKRYVTYWRPVNGPPGSDVFLCAVNSDAYTNHPHLQKMFVELATEVMLNFGREPGVGMTFRVREPVSESNARFT